MKHLNDDALYELAVKIHEDLPFEDNDLQNIDHIGQCQSCYEALQRYLVTLEALEQFRPVRKADLQLVIIDGRALLRQLQGSWCFEAPIAMGAHRGAADAPACLEAVEDDRSRLICDPAARTLSVTLTKPARVWVDGQELVLHRQGSLWCGQLTDLKDGTHSLVVEKA